MQQPATVTAAYSAADARRRVVNLASPALTEMFLVSFVHMADMMMVGRLGPAAIASVGLTGQPILMFQAIYMALNVGTTALVARLFGAGDVERASEASRQTLVVALGMGLTISALAIVFANPILRFMGAAPEVLDHGAPYFRVVGAGLAFNAMAMNMTASLRGAGDTRSPMRVNITANLCNLVGNYVLINGKLGLPALGVFGAGLSTTISRAIAFALFFRILASGERKIRPDFSRPYSFDWPLMQRAFRVGIPAAIEQFILRAGQITFVRVVSSLGTIVYASHQIGMNVLSTTFMPGQAFAVAATTLVGQGLGADRPDEAELNAKEARKLGMIVGCTIAASFFFFGRQIAGLYTKDREVIALTASVLRFYGFVQPAQATQIILAGALRGAGDSKWALYSTAAGVWFGRVAVSYILIKLVGVGLAGAWIAMAMDQIWRSVITSARFGTGRWKLHKV